ncbi:hypothetical protein LFR94_004500 [Vibrio vulnificus]|uniref:hypothetical protein n=1 Tax=Vibrio vulnificus TaxID=672 RepID=UPI001A1862A1|nr:hypothetical protein [Vibrio vulnificus]EGQ7988483.1 hypothetical protein [Vibrio vulnificus]EGQ9240104.1 hypothetical protein [Vibrio vulnificus]EGR7964307.1 hypothetical protein [Vibrio vulnificus]EGR7987231.1 hypothetical protein [Vibrio vulnificus]
MNKQMLVETLNKLSNDFSAEIQDTKQKKEKLTIYRSELAKMDLAISDLNQDISKELDFDKLKDLKGQLQTKEQEHSEMTAIITNLTSYTSDSNYSARLDKIRKMYKEAEKDFYEQVMATCREKIMDVVSKHEELLPLIRDYVVASVGVRNADPVYHYGAPFIDIFGSFVGDEWVEHKASLLHEAGVNDLSHC